MTALKCYAMPFLALLLVIFARGSHASERISDTRNPSAVAYSQKHRISYLDAVRRLAKEAEAGSLKERLVRNHPETFGGIYIQHVPEHRAVVLFTGNAETELRRYTKDPFFTPRRAARSLELLEEVQEAVVEQLDSHDIDGIVSFSLPDQIIKVGVTDTKVATVALRSLIQAFNFIEIYEIRSLPTELSGSDIHGGQGFSGWMDPSDTSDPSNFRSATFGFNVVNETTFEVGVATAAHTTDFISVVDEQPRQMIFRGEEASGNFDLQWHV